MTTFRLPDLGEGLQDAEIVAWHVAEGDRVVADQPLVSVETQKAVVEVPAPWSGHVVKLHGAPGDIIEVGAALVELETEEIGRDAGAVVGELPAAADVKGDLETPARTSAAAQRAKAVPAARARAREFGLALDGIAGTGPDGTVTRDDVEAAARGASQGYEPLRGVRRSMARNMARAHAEVASTTVTDEARIGHWPDEANVTVQLVRAIGQAATAEPALNAWYDAEREARRLHDHVDLGIAVNTEDGLFAPVLRNVAARSEADLRSGLEALRRDLEARSIAPEELLNPTITLSNFGMLGGRHAALVVVPPQVAILGAGRITLEPRVIDDEVRPCRVLPLSLTFDHRVVTGAEATRFLMAIIEALERGNAQTDRKGAKNG
ncbi:MAG: dihydrolipoamide acetyltransferase family protein [Methyloligellaceae bacterium]